MILLSELADEHVDIDQQSTKVKTFLIEKNRLVKDTETKMLITFTNNIYFLQAFVMKKFFRKYF